MSAQARPVVDEQNSWPGPFEFDEAASAFFNGRDDYIADLLRLTAHSSLTVLHGASGLGKTSLVKAGLFPLLRKQGVLPVYVRFAVGEGTAPLIEQVSVALRQELQHRNIEAPEFDLDETLWQYLHSAGLEMWDPQNQFVTPLFVFDQFEEVFTLGAQHSAAIARLRVDLADLIENRVPAGFAGTDGNLSTDRQPYRALISLRADYLSAL